MRIIGGAQRGTKLAEIGRADADAHLRPTSDRVRESIFNLLINGGYGDPIRDARVLDLFAGTGALALEALSRGAKMAVMLDTARIARGLQLDNVTRCRQDARTKIVGYNCTQLPPADSDPFDLVFCDPPYGKGMGQRALGSALRGGWIAPKAIIVLEDGVTCAPPDGFMAYDTRRYGETWVHIWGVAN